MSVIITPQEKIDEYFNSDALSQSQLKKILKGIDVFINSNEEEKKLYYEEKGHFVIGSAVDTILTGEAGEFEKQYHISTLVKKPSDVEMSIIQKVFDELKDVLTEIEDLPTYLDSIEQSIVEHDWYGGKPGEKRIQGLLDRGAEYFEDLKKGLGKQILTAVEKKLIDDIVFSLKSNPRTMQFFNRIALDKRTDADIYYQLPIYFYYKGIYCKALLDMLIVIKDEDGNILSLTPIDLKTMNGSTLRFLSNLKSFRYDIQAAWYTEALLSDNSSFDLKCKITEKMVLPFMFVVESNSYPGQPLVYILDEQLLHIGKYGKKDLRVQLPSNNYDEVVIRKVEGFDELIDIYLYQEANDWNEEEVITKNNGVLKIDWNGIKT